MKTNLDFQPKDNEVIQLLADNLVPHTENHAEVAPVSQFRLVLWLAALQSNL